MADCGEDGALPDRTARRPHDHGRAGPKHPGALERPHVMYDVSLSLQIVQPLPHPSRAAAAFKDLALKHGAGCTGQSVRSAFDLRGPVELRRDR